MRYTKEFKDSAIQLALNSDKTVKAIAQDLGMNAKTLYNLVYNYKKDNNLLVNHNKSSKSKIKESEQEELRRLRKENRLLKQERDILKKATAYFAKETL
jgi:transposase